MSGRIQNHPEPPVARGPRAGRPRWANDKLPPRLQFTAEPILRIFTSLYDNGSAYLTVVDGSNYGILFGVISQPAAQ